IVLDNCLTAKDDYTLTSPIFEAESVTASADGHKVTAVCKLKAGWKDNIENATEAMALSGTGILEAADFAAGGTVGTTASVQATVVSGDEAIVVCVPGNVCTTSMAAAEPEPVDPTEPSEPVDPSNPTDPSTPADTQDQVNTAEDAPTTGDETSMGLLVGLFMLTVISLAGIIFLRRSSIKK
ncbi:MAG: LPXTG cell wall anchor domain-containing protein, partial [Oscillospiraceae bacterium]